MTSDTYTRFTGVMTAAGYAVESYNGRYQYHGVAVRTDDLEKAMAIADAASISCAYDQMGKGHVVYPLTRMDWLNGVRLIEELQAKYPRLDLINTAVYPARFTDEEAEHTFKLHSIPWTLDRLAGATTDLRSISSPEAQNNPLRSGRCYELALGFLMLNNCDWTMVHGILILETGVEYWHAFCENGATVYDPVLDEFYDRETYYEFYDVHCAKYYTMREALDESLKYETYGPWPPAIAGGD